MQCFQNRPTVTGFVDYRFHCRSISNLTSVFVKMNPQHGTFISDFRLAFTTTENRCPEMIHFLGNLFFCLRKLSFKFVNSDDVDWNVSRVK